MGYGNYHDDVRTAQRAIGTTRQSADAFQYHERAARGEEQSVHPDLNIKGKRREARDSAEHPESTPIVVAMDVTSSRGDDAKAIYEQVPSLLGSLRVSGVVPGPQICWAAIGDANTDKAALQVGQFESDRRIDSVLSNIWMEAGGGGTGEESYELLAYYLAHKTELDSLIKRATKGYLFFTGDEAPYPTVSRQFVKQLIGDTLESDIATEIVFRAVQEKFHTFLIFPRSSMEDRLGAIDTEIRKRLEAAGGRFKDVSIRASLIWHNRNDLDLHCETPAGEHIYYGAKRARCGGELDVDRNVRGETTKPVENIRWAKGDARTGKYRFWVENYCFHESPKEDTPFKVELDIEGEIQTFEGVIPAGRTHTSSATTVFEFTYTPNQRESANKEAHAAYRDDVILGKWGRYIPTAQILRVSDPASSVEVMIGAIALQEGKFDLDGFTHDMESRRVPKARREDVVQALQNFAAHGVFPKVDSSAFA